ncbi:MAG: PEP/pyruvate-binding domain-containing protein [SAR324 cluster bacterium]|nr:PEP/pyruvate-binding domain-containing protein [SAR324 cluster bacterium]
MNAKEKHVYLFSELDQAEAYAKDGWDSVRGLLGGKGANLADMTRLGVPVPPGLTVTTESCNTFWKPVKSSRKECGTRFWKD